MKINRNTISKLIYWTTAFMLICQFLISDLRFPSSIMILLDILVLCGVLLYIRKMKQYIPDSNTTVIFLIVLLLTFTSFAGVLWNRSSIRLFFHGLRINGKYFLLFFIAAFSLKEKDILKFFELLQTFLWINVIACTIQYFLFGYRGDHCGGLFGTGNANGWLNIFLCIITAYTVCSYICGSKKLKHVVLNCMACAYLSALSELKFYFFELAIIFILAIMLSKPSVKKVAVGIVGILFLLFLSQMVDLLWSSSSSSAFTLEGIQYYFSEKAYGYASVGDFGRIGGIGKASKYFFGGKQSILGMGLGMCGYGTPFYSKYSHLHYIWFSYLYIYLEQGWIGLLIYVAFFVFVLVGSRKVGKKIRHLSSTSNCLALFAQCLAVIGIILLWYNTTVTNYQAYFLFISLAFPFALMFQEKRITNK